MKTQRVSAGFCTQMTEDGRPCTHRSKTGDCGRHSGTHDSGRSKEAAQVRSAARAALAAEKKAAESGDAFSLAGQLCRKGKSPTEHQQRMKAVLEEALDGETWLRTLEMRARLAQSRTINGRANRMLAAVHCARIGGSGEVASASAWKKAGREVKEDAKGFPIWVPREIKNERFSDQEQSDGSGPDEADEPRTFTVLRFGGNAKYYDITETDGDETAETRWGRIASETTGDGGENDEAFRDAMQGAVESLGLRFVRAKESDMKGPANLASLNWREGEIRVREGLTPAAEAASIAHELGHYTDPFLAKFGDDADARARAYRTHRDECEFVAESVAYAIAHAWGVDTANSSAEYLHGWRPERARQAKNLVERGETAMESVLGVASPEKQQEWLEAGPAPAAA